MLDPRIKQCLLTSHECRHLTVHACSIFSIIHLFFSCPKTNMAAWGVFAKIILKSSLMNLNTGKLLKIFLALCHSFKFWFPPPAKSIDHFFSKDNKIWWKPALWAFFWSAFTPGLAGSTLPVEAGGCTGVPFSYAGVGQCRPPPPTQQLWLFKGQAAVNAPCEMCQRQCTRSTFVKLPWQML